MSHANTKPRAPAIAIGELSERTGVNIETIRYYERIGLLPAPPRSASRRRLYQEPHRRRLAFVRRARELGFSLEEVRTLLGLGSAQELTCREVSALTQRHLRSIRDKIRDLKKLERTLSDLAGRCHGDDVPDCPILEALSDDA